ncbi:hypothetical protein [Pteropox virus]|uniref:Uncharacterized protein n=1 Tax=Pteropox virus TaxID=1873698 RepID=A0A1B1MRM9_9POXV|nr:hypothetical protein [Pteropox virus]ANS71222.1 hypothetical protein [Pteropox virus]
MHSKLSVAVVSVFLIYTYTYATTFLVGPNEQIKNQTIGKRVYHNICVPPNNTFPINVTCYSKVESTSNFDSIFWLNCDDTNLTTRGCTFPNKECCTSNYKRINHTMYLNSTWDHEIRNTLIVRNDTNLKSILKCVYQGVNVFVSMFNITKFINEGDRQGHKVCNRYNKTQYNYIYNFF